MFEQIVDEPEVEAWLICWMPGHDTGFHDHDLSSGAVTVVEGAVREERLGLARVLDIYLPGDIFDFTASEIHRVTHTGTEAAVTVHAYSPRLRRLGAYAVTPEGALQRHPLGYGEELRPCYWRYSRSPSSDGVTTPIARHANASPGRAST